MNKPARHVLDVYDAVMHAATTEKQWAKIRKEVPGFKKKIESAGLTCFALWVPNKGLATAHCGIFIDLAAHGNDTAALVNTIAHEATHAAGNILDHVGQEYEGNISEAHAYLVGWISSWVWRYVQEAA